MTNYQVVQSSNYMNIKDNVQTKISGLLTSRNHKSTFLEHARAKVGVASEDFRSMLMHVNLNPYHLYFLSAAPE